MRHLFPVLLVPILAGCATGYAQDWFRSRTSIINPQLLRYGLDVPQSRCVAERLGARLGRSGLRDLQEAAAAVRPAAADAVLTVRNLQAVASGVGGRSVRMELDSSLAACNVDPDAVIAAAAAAPAEPAAAPASAAAGTRMSGGVPVDPTPLPAPGAAPAAGAAAAAAGTWLNLGAAASGQSIAIDATSILQDGPTRTAWFRMSDPESGGPTNNAYRLKIDCQARTVQPLALRQTGGDGQPPSLREYTPEESRPGPAESGTVLEIAFLSLCT